jgi:hypothetical protein
MTVEPREDEDEEVDQGEIKTHISRESPGHSGSESFPECSDSVRGDQLSSTIEETRVRSLRS